MFYDNLERVILRYSYSDHTAKNPKDKTTS